MTFAKAKLQVLNFWIALMTQCQEHADTGRADTYDGLTDIAGAGSLHQYIIRKSGKNKDGTGSGSLIFVELENYAAICKKFGGSAGDKALLLLAHNLQGRLCDKEEFFRADGGVFVLLLEGTGVFEAADRAQSIIRELNRLSLAYNEEEIKLYTSLGVKSFGESNMPEEFSSIAR